MTLRKISEMSKINKQEQLDLDLILQNYKTADDLSLINKLAVDLNIEEYVTDHKSIYTKDLTSTCTHPSYIEDIIYALNVFEGCCYTNLSLAEKKISVTAALFKQTKKAAFLSLFQEHKPLPTDVQKQFKQLFIQEVVKLHSKKSKPTKKDTVMAMVLWDAKNMNLYHKDFDAFGYLYTLFFSLEKTEPSVAFQMSKLLNAEYVTNWAKLKAYKLNWPHVVKNIFTRMPKVKELF